jgi:hypothetical protein
MLEGVLLFVRIKQDCLIHLLINGNGRPEAECRALGLSGIRRLPPACAVFGG